MIIRDVLEKEITRWTQVLNENAGGMCEECEHCIAWHDCVKDVSVPMAELWWRIDALEQFDRLEDAHELEFADYGAFSNSYTDMRWEKEKGRK